MAVSGASYTARSPTLCRCRSATVIANSLDARGESALAQTFHGVSGIASPSPARRGQARLSQGSPQQPTAAHAQAPKDDHRREPWRGLADHPGRGWRSMMGSEGRLPALGTRLGFMPPGAGRRHQQSQEAEPPARTAAGCTAGTAPSVLRDSAAARDGGEKAGGFTPHCRPSWAGAGRSGRATTYST